MNRRKEKNVRMLEHLKNFSSEILNAWKSGAGSDEAPITVDVAIGKLWHELETCLIDKDPGSFERVAWYRVSCPQDKPLKLNAPIISSRYLGPRKAGSEGVYYLTVFVRSADEAAACFDHILSQGFTVRDWHYGCHRH